MRHIRWLAMFLLAAVLIVVYTTGDFKKKELKIPWTEIEWEYYPTFEDYLTDATHVFYGTFKGIYINKKGYVEYKFHVNQTLKGNKVASTIYIPGSSVGSSQIELKGMPYEKGKKYLLVLERNRSVLYDHDLYEVLGRSIFPLDNLGKSYIVGGSIDELSNFNFNENATVISLTAYINKRVKTKEAQKAPEYESIYEFTDSNKLSEIVEFSQCIYKIRVDKIGDIGTYINYEDAKCEILEILYGEFIEDTIGTNIFIYFISGTVRQGNEYIVLLSKAKSLSHYYEVSSKKSVHSVREYNRIVRLVDKLKD